MCSHGERTRRPVVAAGRYRHDDENGSEVGDVVWSTGRWTVVYVVLLVVALWEGARETSPPCQRACLLPPVYRRARRWLATWLASCWGPAPARASHGHDETRAERAAPDAAARQPSRV